MLPDEITMYVMVNTSENTANDAVMTYGSTPSAVNLPRTITKKALRAYFNVTGYTFRTYYFTRDLKDKLGILNSDQDRATRIFTIEQTKIIIEHFQLSTEELEIIHSYM